jgi:hypothetical protein
MEIPFEPGAGNRGICPSVPVVIPPINAIAGCLKFGNVIGPTLIDLLIDMRLNVSELSLGP